MFGELWESFTDALEGLGSVVHFLFRLLVHSPRALMRFDLISQQIYNSGALSLVIIMLSGIVRRHGARPAGLPAAAAIRLGRGPRDAASHRLGEGTGTRGDRSAVRRPRRHGAGVGTGADAGDGSDFGDGNDGGRSDPARGGAAILGRRDYDAAARRHIQRHRPVTARSSSACRSWASTPASFWSQMRAAVRLCRTSTKAS